MICLRLSLEYDKIQEHKCKYLRRVKSAEEEIVLRIKICSDSTCDLSAALIERYHIGIMPLHVHLGERACRDGVDVSPADIFGYVDATGQLPTTSAIVPADYAEFFRPYAAEYDAVIHVNIGSGFSSCYQNACIAAEEFNNVYVVDSENLSAGQGLIVLSCVKRAAEGANPQSILAEMKELAPRVETSFLIDRLDYLYKGGRCSSLAALGANLLKLKPCIEVKDGKMGVCKKYRGNYDKCLATYIRERLSGRSERLERDWIFLTHTTMDSKALSAAQTALAEFSDMFQEQFETIAGSTVSCHCGPNTLGILYIRERET